VAVAHATTLAGRVARFNRVLSRRIPADRVRLGARVVVGPGVRFDVARGGAVEIGDDVVIGERARFHVSAGGRVVVGRGTRIGERAVVVAHERVAIGDGCVVGAEVVLQDAAPVVEDADVPVRLQGVASAPIVLGGGVRLDATAVILAGVTVGDGAHVGMRAVVTEDVAPGGDVEGSPARRAGTPPAPVPAGRRLVRRG
jgi:acetyltransferase-like isoleucine patch superfamily enzyme